MQTREDLRCTLDAERSPRGGTAVTLGKRFMGVYLALVAVNFAIMFTAASVGFLNGRFLFCFAISLTLGLGCAYEHSQKDSILEAMVSYYKSEARAKENYGFQLLLWKVKVALAVMILALAVYFLFRYGSHS
jgi:hypothetical protein